MSASTLHHIHGVNSVQYKSTQFINGMTIFTAELEQSDQVCPECKSSHLHFKGSVKRRLQMCPTGSKSCWLHLTIRKRKCADCLYSWWTEPSFVSGQRRMVRSFEKYIIRLTARMTLKDVSKELGVSWHTVKNIHKDYLTKRYSKPFPLNELVYIGIDEFSTGKGHDYMTIFINLETAQIIYAVEGRSRDDIIPFLIKLRNKGVNLKAVAIDMSGPYKSAVDEFLPKLEIVFDRFHIMKLMNGAIDDIRREQQRNFSIDGCKVLKGSRFLLLRNLDSLDPTQRSSLQTLLAMNAPLASAHVLKEQLREFWKQPDIVTARSFLLNWIFTGAFETDIAQLIKVSRTFLRHYKGITAYYNHKITNATTEGVNNKIETLKRQSYGFRDIEYFKLRLYHLHVQKSELLG